MMKRKVSVIVLSMLMTLLCSCDGFIANHSIPEHSPGMLIRLLQTGFLIMTNFHSHMKQH